MSEMYLLFVPFCSQSWLLRLSTGSLLVLLLALLPLDAAQAARSGGRMGGSSRAASAPRAAPRPSARSQSTARWGRGKDVEISLSFT